MRGLLIYIFVGIAFFSSCRTELPEDAPSEAIFFVRGEINGEKIDLSAGDSEYYMLPFFEDDTMRIRSFKGVLGLFNCVGDVNCPQSIQFSFREKEIQNGVRESISKSLYSRTCDVRGPATYWFESYKATFISKSTPTGVAHTWYFGDGNSSNDINPVHYYVNSSDSIVSPTLVVDDVSAGCQNSISYPINFEAPCVVDFNPKYELSQFTLNAFPTIGRTELWSYDGDAYQPFASKGPPLDSINLVCLQSTEDVTNCVSYKCKNVILDTAAVFCAANFDVFKETVTIKDVKDYLETTVIWQNSFGKIYRSDLFNQPQWQSFEIISAEDYKNAPNGDATQKLTVSFSLRLFGVSKDDFVDISSNKSVIAVAYPKI